MRPEMKLPTTHAWYLTYQAAHEGRTVAEVAARLLSDAIAVEVAKLNPRQRRMLDLSCPKWMWYEGDAWSEENGATTLSGKRVGGS